ncbi:hypothetical protein J2W24_003138 [Variovorax boronicumulans]|uniref:hypothetical protein n=1 Tax=Variovorax boronicumulans TaxID=436515 RepID=UPI002780577B|nr:hypothetical protein [Variovorax boronicumulans]MDP9917487.1 hypothetical protein [Variovorax boronicumulans]
MQPIALSPEASKRRWLVLPAGQSTRGGDKPATVRRFVDGFDITNPVIKQLHVEWKDKLVLHGTFGSEPGTVSVGGTELPVTL